jgi:predicted nuclease of predicted toxin-antitoxin system
MNLSPNWVDRLNTAGLPAIHWSSIDRMDATDIEIMAYAAEHGYVVLTHDLDFRTMRDFLLTGPSQLPLRQRCVNRVHWQAFLLEARAAMSAG